jgi:hypothetical protein
MEQQAPAHQRRGRARWRHCGAGQERRAAVAFEVKGGGGASAVRPLPLHTMRRKLHDAVAAADDRASWKATIRTTSPGSS